MFGKLMKYEMRYLIRIFAPMWAIVFSLCAFSRVILRPDMNGMMVVEGSEAILPIVAVMLAVTGIITMMVVTTVVLLQRFYKGMYGDEGYLMFTLPVTTGSLIHSKALSAFIMMIVTELVTLAGVLIMISYPEIWKEFLSLDLGEMLQMLLDMNQISAAEFAALVFMGVVVGALTVLQGIYTVYLAISIGQLWKKHPIAGAIGAYYGITLVINAVIGGLGVNRQGYHFATNMEYGAAMAAALIVSTVCCVVLIGISFVGTKLVMDKKLNIA